MDPRLKRILPRVQKPARYTGGEYKEIQKDKSEVDTRFAFCFPDNYEIGMSNLGVRILYAAHEPRWTASGASACFAPWGGYGGGDAPGGHPALWPGEWRSRRGF